MSGRDILQAAVIGHPESYAASKLLDYFHHFEEIKNVLGNEWIPGWGSYLFNGVEYKYQRETLKKQEALFRVGQVSTHVLEIGVYVGHSLLILLISNPHLKITCVDNDSRYTPKVVSYLNTHFDNRVTLIMGDGVDVMRMLPDNTYDAVHIDTDHNIPVVTAQFNEARRVAKASAYFIFDDYDNVSMAIIEWINNKILKFIELPQCLWTNIVTRLVDK
jgi:ubiquinone/menaquinone biosynthesis C-methylase UbiE